MWVKLLTPKHVEVQGKYKHFKSGDWIEVGKQTAMKWIEAGEALAGASQKVRPRPRPENLTEPAFTLFAIPMAFQGPLIIKQRNALMSWTLLEPRPSVVLFGDESGIADAAAEFEAIHLPRLEYNEFGTPVVGDVFLQTQKLVKENDVVCYVNSDIILCQDFADALMLVAGAFEQFLMVGQRWDVDLTRPMQFREGWEKRLRRMVASEGKCHGVGAVDYFAFRPGLYEEIPAFAVGRSCWDNWLVGHALAQDVPVVDASDVATAVHQDRFGPGGEPPIMTEERLVERRRNRAFYDADRTRHGYTGKISEAGWIVQPDGQIVERDRR